MSSALSRAQFGRVWHLANRVADGAFAVADAAIAPVADPIWRRLAAKAVPSTEPRK